jgi:aerobic carbon-monoxide dehydrogenase large subunit
MRRLNTFIGSPLERVEDFRFLRGRGQYVDDLAPAGLWHAAVVRSQVAHGRIRSIDTRAARAMPGVHAVLTAADIGRPVPTIPFRRPLPEIMPYAQPVIADDKVRYVGEPIALVLADRPDLAEDAIAGVVVDIEHLPPVTGWQTAAEGSIELFEGAVAKNCASVFNAWKGEAEAAFQSAPYRRREQFRVQRMTAMTMETRGLLAQWDAEAGRLTVSGAAKLPFFNRNSMAKMMGLPPTSVDYIEYDVGGGFGARGEFYPEDYLVAFAARHCGHPVKWVEDRREHFMTIAHSRQCEADIEIALDRDGTFIGLRAEYWCDIGAYVRPNGMTPVRNVAQFTSGPYRIPNIGIKAHAFVTNKTPSGTFRGPGRFEGSFFIERLLDMAARDLAVDRLDIRRRNLLRQSEMPYPLATIEPNEGMAYSSCDSGDYPVAFDRCMVEAGWSEKAALSGKLIEGRYHGVGVACFIEGGGSGPRENARMEVERDGSIAVYVGSSSVGQGIETIMAQIAADALELPVERVKIMHGSTTYLHEGFGSYGSRGTVMGGSAIVVAANALMEKFRAEAASRLGVAAADVVVADGVASASGGASLTLADIASQTTLAADGTFSSSKPTYTYGTAVAQVAVDAQTGFVEVLDYVTVDDVGRIINPLTLHGQVIGAAVQGMGSVFTEEISYDEDGQLLVGSLVDYMVPLATDYPRLTAISLEDYPCPNNPLGTKGAGEGGIIPVGGAVVNAVASALGSLGVEPRELPLTPPRLWQLIQDARGR